MQESQNGNQRRVRLVGAFAGIGSGLTKVAIGHGFDTIKTRLQCSPPGTYQGAIDCLLKTVRNESVRALYKGASPPAVGWAAIDSVLLGSLHNYRLYLRQFGFSEPVPGQDRVRLTLFGHGIAGLFAGWTSAVVATPIETLKVKLQLQLQRSVKDRQFKSPIDCAKQIIATQGVLGLWRGFTGSLAFRSGFFFMFLSFEALMRAFSRFKGTPLEMSTATANFWSGGLGSFAFWGVAIPADNLKNRIMGSPLDSNYSPLRAVAKDIMRSEGIGGFYRGFVPIVLRAFPVNAGAFLVYESIMRGLNAEKTRE